MTNMNRYAIRQKCDGSTYERNGVVARGLYQECVAKYGFELTPGGVYLTQYPRVEVCSVAGSNFLWYRLEKKTLLMIYEVTLIDSFLANNTRVPSISISFYNPDDHQDTLTWMGSEDDQGFRAAFQTFRPLEWHTRYRKYLAKLRGGHAEK